MPLSTIINTHTDWGSTDVIYSYDHERAYREVIKKDLKGIVTKYSFKWLGKKKWHREGNVVHFVRTEKNLILWNSFIILDMIARK